MKKDVFDQTDELLQMFTEMLVGTVTCIIPDGILTDEEKHILDSIDPMVMDYDILYKKPITGHEPWGWAIKPSKIFYNRKLLRDYLSGIEYGVSPPDITFLILIKITLHEMIHLIYPNHSEEKVYELTDEWLNAFNWRYLKPKA